MTVQLAIRKERQEASKSSAVEKGASTWLTSLPLEEFGFSLHKGAFRDALALCYGWLPQPTVTVGKVSLLSMLYPAQRGDPPPSGTMRSEILSVHNVCVEPHL